MKDRKFETHAVHFGEMFGEKGSLNVPIYQNSTFKQKIPGKWEPFTYTRTNNPTEEALRKSLAQLENGTYGVVFSSGLAAVHAVIELLSNGDHIVSAADVYGGTHRLFTQFAEKRGLQFTYVDSDDTDAVRKAMRPNTKMVYIETPSNPLLRITDLPACAVIAKEKGALLVVDNTMATPFLQRPLDLGADIVIHSLSKYLSGHTNVVGGAVIAKDAELLEKLRFIHKALGACPGPFDCFLTMLGLKTLAVRMRQHEQNAHHVAVHLSKHKKVRKVIYPGLPSHPHHARAKEQMSGFGGIVSFELHGDEQAGITFIENLDLFALSISFGSVTSLVSFPARMSHKEMKREERIQRGFADSLVRLSLGIEHIDDIVGAIDTALDKV